jgi:hypothetical protein
VAAGSLCELGAGVIVGKLVLIRTATTGWQTLEFWPLSAFL